MPPMCSCQGHWLSSLTTGDVTKLSQLASIRGFSRILSDVVIRNSALWLNSGQTQNLTNAVLALNSVTVDENDEGIKTAWRWWTDAASRMEKWAPVTAQTGNALSVLIKRSKDTVQIGNLLKSAGRTIPRTSEGAVDNSDSALRKYVSDMKPILEFLPRLPENAELIVGGSGRTYVNLLIAGKAVLRDQFYTIAPRIRAQNPDEITDVLGEMVRSIQVTKDFPQMVAILSSHSMHLLWQPVIEAIESIFSNTNNNFLQVGYQASLEAALVLTNSDPAAIKMLQTLATKGSLHHNLALAEFVNTRAGSVTALILLLFGSADPTEWPGRAREGAHWFSEWLNAPVRKPGETKAVADLAIEFSQVQRLQGIRDRSKKVSPAVSAMLHVLER